MFLNRFIILAGVAFLSACSPVQLSKTGKSIDVRSVNTQSGRISGTLGSDGRVRIFRGIPYAAPPVGELRWKPPIPAKPWKGIRNCTIFPPSAMQGKPTPILMWTREFMAPVEPLSEDCLYLNLWTAAITEGEKRPVMVWIHGGAFIGGSGSVPLYDGEEMAKKGVVYITINYRLGVFGFLAHPDLSAESPYRVSGNYGILDQIAALKWIRNNVAAFGGDPDRVTIAGQSAGAFSVNALMVSPLAKGLFHRAIAQSGGMFSSDMGLITSLEDAEQAGLRLAQTLGAEGLDELRALPADQLLKAGGRPGVNIDGYVIPPAYLTFERSAQNDVPLISGWNADDGFAFGPPAKAEAFRSGARQRYGSMAEEFLRLFPAGSDSEAVRSQKLLTSLAFGWQNYCWAALQSRTGRNKAYLYYFTRVPPGLPNYGAFHSAEFAYALKTLRLWDRPFTSWDHRLSEIMSSYWVNFAASGNPNEEGLPEWKAFDPDSGRVQELGDQVAAIRLPFREQLDFLDRIQKINRNIE